MKHRSVICLLPIACCLFLTSCSISKQIARSAQKVKTDSSLLAAHVGISIYEAASGKYWYNFQGDKYFVPASNTKIPTCYAAMKYLGDSLTGLNFRITENGLLYIRGSADPTFLHPDFKKQPVYEFLKKFKQIQYTGDLFDDFLGNGWSWNDYMEPYMAQRSDFPVYGNIASLKWINKNEIEIIPSYFKEDAEILTAMENGFRVERSWETNIFQFTDGREKSKSTPFYPHAGIIMNLLKDTLKASVNFEPLTPDFHFNKMHSQPTDSLLKPMMHRSDNFFAEQVLMMVSNEMLGVMSDEKIIDTILKTDFKDLPQKPRWADGSGLSRYNLFTPQDFVIILNKMKNEFGIERMKEILPSGGEGTLGSYFKADSNYFFAKTGTLSGVVALSGFFYTKKNRLLLFSVLVNNHQASATAVRRVVEIFLQEIRDRY